MLTRDEHFKRLNSYRNSREYAEYAVAIGISEHGDVTLPSMLGARWEISERIYSEFLNMLPPFNWRGSSFMMREFCFAAITTKYTRQGERYFCEFVDVTHVEIP